MNKHNIKVGQTVYSLNVGNAARRCEQVLTERTVTKVGRKYFYYTEYSCDVKISFEYMDDSGKYSANTKVYLSPEDREEEKLANSLLWDLQQKIQYANVRQSGWTSSRLKGAMDMLGIDYDK